MWIGEVSRITGLSKDTIRFYEKKGLLQVVRSSSEYNNYKVYTSDHLHRLQLIRKAKQFGFTLNEISDLLILSDEHMASCSVLRTKISDKLLDIDRKIEALMEIKSLILSRVEDAKSRCEMHSKDENCKVLV